MKKLLQIAKKPFFSKLFQFENLEIEESHYEVREIKELKQKNGYEVIEEESTIDSQWASIYELAILLNYHHSTLRKKISKLKNITKIKDGHKFLYKKSQILDKIEKKKV